MNLFTYLRSAFIFSLLLNLNIQVNNLHAAQPVDLGQVDFSQIDVNALRDEVREVENYLNSLPPEERQRIENDALRLLEQMPEEKFNEFLDLTEKVAQPTTDVPMEPAITEPKLEQEEPIAPINVERKKKNKKQTQNLRSLLQTLVDKIDAVELKIKSLHRVSKNPSEEQLWNDTKPTLHQIRSLVQRILNPIGSDKDMMLTKLVADEQRSLRQRLQKVQDILVRNEQLIKVPDIMGVKHPGKNERHEQIDPVTQKRSIQAVKTLLQELNKASITTLSRDLENFINKTAPKEIAKEKGRPAPAQTTLQKSPQKSTWQPPQPQAKQLKTEMPSKPIASLPSENQTLATIKQEFSVIKKTIDQQPTLARSMNQKIEKTGSKNLIAESSDLKVFTALDEVREHGRKILRQIKTIGALSEAQQTELRTVYNESRIEPLGTQLTDAKKIITHSSPYEATVTRAQQTCQELKNAMNGLISKKALT